MDNDVFRPRNPAAAMIYDALIQEAKRRQVRDVLDWTSCEIAAVHAAAVKVAAIYELKAPSIEDVRKAERYASGSVDYAKKWAYAVFDAMAIETTPQHTN